MAAQPSEKPTYKLHYFNVKALAEPLRILFAYAKVDYEDIRVPKEEWPALKPTMPMGQMPVLEIDGIRLHQSIAIGRYLSKKFGLAGANDWENLLIDIAIDTVNDFRQSEFYLNFINGCKNTYLFNTTTSSRQYN